MRKAPSSRSPMACRPSPSPARVRGDDTGSRSSCSPIRIATSFCSALIFRRSTAASRTTISMPSSRRTWSTAVRATRPGSTITRACRCFLPKEAAPRSRWAARPPFSRERRVTSASRTAGRISPGISSCAGAMIKRPTAMSPLTGEIDLNACPGSFVLALGFGRSAAEAALHVRASLNDGVDQAMAGYAASWRAWQAVLLPLDAQASSGRPNTYRISTAVLRTHEESSYAGGYIASLSIPWGFAKGDEDLGGYHLVWPRDLVETAGGLLAAGARSEVRRILRYLQAIQEPDGHWPQNCWLDGTPYWNGVQMGECAFPILLADLVRREVDLPEAELRGLWPMVKRAAAFIAMNGPVTAQDRWEEDGGDLPVTLAVEIAALP